MLTKFSARSLFMLALLGWLPPGRACAEIAASASITSNYLFRGISLSDDRPGAQLNLGYDNPSGWYAGTQVADVRLYGYRHSAQLLAYGGYARHGPLGLSWDIGAGQTVFSRHHAYDYREWFVGVADQSWEARVYYSPGYFGYAGKTLYSEINASRPLVDPLRLIAHIGMLRSLTHSATQYETERSQFDSRLGVAADIRQWNLALVWAAVSRTAFYPVDDAPRRRNWLVSVTHSF